MARKIVFFLYTTLLVLFIGSCTEIPSVTEEDESSNESISESETITSSVSITSLGDHESDEDYTWEDSDVYQIYINGNGIEADTSIGAKINGSKITITAVGNYEISGNLSDGQIVVNIDESGLTSVNEFGKTSSVNSDGIVRIILNGVNIFNSSTSPIYIENSPKTILVLKSGSENYLSDGSSYVFESIDEDEPNATIFSKDDLTIYGDGNLTVNANYNDGISSKDGVIIKSGNLNVKSVDDGIRGKDYVIVRGGSTTVNSSGDGIKSDNEEDSTSGFIKIESGTLNITSLGDAITAQTNVIISDGNITIKSGGGSSYYNSTVSAKGIKAVYSLSIVGGTFSINSADDGLHSNYVLIIDGGDISIASGDDGIHADNTVTINNGNIEITKCNEGVEGNYIIVNDGNINVTSSDDSFNSSAGTRTENDDNSCTYIHGGYIVLIPSNGDGLDSNGDMQMTGGTVIIHGPSNQPEVMIDYNGTFNISGGFLTSSGSSSNMTQAPSPSSTQYAIKIMFSSSISASTIFHLQDSNGNNIVTFQPIKKYQSIVFSSPNLQKGKSYSIYKGGSSTGNTSDGLYEGGTYSGGSLYKTFTISNTITNVN